MLENVQSTMLCLDEVVIVCEHVVAVVVVVVVLVVGVACMCCAAGHSVGEHPVYHAVLGWSGGQTESYDTGRSGKVQTGQLSGW